MRFSLFQHTLRWTRWDPEAGPIPSPWLDFGEFQRLTDRQHGTAVREARSSWVRTFDLDGQQVYAKTYDYPSFRDRRRGIGRNTALARSRAAREFDALRFLAGLDSTDAHGSRSPALGVAELRRGPLLHRALLLTRAVPGTAVDQVWPTLAPTDQDSLEQALWEQVARWHEAGFRDRNLDPRNLIARSTPSGWQFSKIDSPRFRIVPPGRSDDRLARADRERLRAGLRALRGD